MSQLPTYQIEENALIELEKILAQIGGSMFCTKSEYIQNDTVEYREWEVKATDGFRLIMWAKRPRDKASENSPLMLTLGSPDGKRGLKLLRLAEDGIVAVGGKKIA